MMKYEGHRVQRSVAFLTLFSDRDDDINRKRQFLMTNRIYHIPPPPENNGKDQPRPIRRWQPGEPIPKNFDPDPWMALRRNAEAHEIWMREEQKRAARKRRAS